MSALLKSSVNGSDYRFWSSDERDILRALAPLGIKECCRGLPGRAEGAIRHHAIKHGIRIAPLPKGDPDGKRWRGKLPIPAHAHPFVRRLYTEANRQHATIAEVADRAGLERHRIPSWAHQVSPRIEELVAALNVLGYDLTIVSVNRTDAP